jgi:anti-sigma factor RsiW
VTRHLDDTQYQLAAEGSLDEAERGWVEDHLATCDHCRRAVEGYQDLLSQLNAVPVAEAPSVMAESVMMAYRRTSEPIHALWSDRKLLIAAALSNAVLLGVVLVTVGVQGPLNLFGDWAIGIKDMLLSALTLVPVVKAIWTGMAHGGIAVFVVLAVALVTVVAALRQTLGMSEETS